jgi:S-adenosylmethionine:tRNA ribosyltransferase-isomerase
LTILKIDHIDINNYNYRLDESRIAKYPLEKRDNSKILLCRPDQPINHKPFKQIVDEIATGSLIVYNNTKVIHARLEFHKVTGARIEIFCLSPVEPVEYQLMFTAKSKCTWNCMVGNLKKWKNEILEQSVKIGKDQFILKAEKITTDQTGGPLISFSWNNEFSFAEVLEAVGKIPIPPYLNRETEDIDTLRYQTVYSKHNGSVAAPTAGLHFTDKIFTECKQKNIDIAELTLHVGAGTFQAVKTENALLHSMHGEQFIVSRELIKQLLLHKNTIIATGTTTTRTLESIFWLGVKAQKNEKLELLEQWYWKENPTDINRTDSLTALLNYLERENRDFLIATTEIMIVPGYDFRIIDAIITNFHQPKSTLLLLISAFIGERWHEVYDYALRNDFRFLSYGDSSLLFRH